MGNKLLVVDRISEGIYVASQDANIIGERVLLRPLQSEDLPLLARWNGDEDISSLAGKKFERANDAAAWLEDLLASPRRRGFAIQTHDGHVIGDLEFEDIDWSEGTAELRICIGEKQFWGYGLGGESIQAAVDHAFNCWNLQSIYLRVPLTNWRAIRCYDRCGFKPEGILRAGRRRAQGWMDMILMVRERDVGS